MVAGRVEATLTLPQDQTGITVQLKYRKAILNN